MIVALSVYTRDVNGNHPLPFCQVQRPKAFCNSTLPNFHFLTMIAFLLYYLGSPLQCLFLYASAYLDNAQGNFSGGMRHLLCRQVASWQQLHRCRYCYFWKRQ